MAVHGGWIFGFTESEMEIEKELVENNNTQNETIAVENETINNMTTIEVETAQEEVEIPKNSELFAEEFKHKTINTKTPNLPKKGRARTF